MEPKQSSMIYVLDFGGQTAHLITRRLKELGAQTKFIVPEDALAEIEKERPAGIVLSGGPMSVYEKNAPTVDTKIFELGIPILGICYGFQIVPQLLGGEVISGRKEYGPAKVRIKNKESRITKELPKEFTVWMNHGDEIVKLPKDFEVVGETEHVPFTFSVSTKRNIYGILFHPEVEHTEFGLQILKNFLDICGIKPFVILSVVEASHSTKSGVKDPSTRLSLGRDDKFHYLSSDEMIQKIRETVGSAHVIGAVSGGVDSTVAATLVAKAIGKQFTPIFVNNGLMRPDAVESVRNLFKRFDIQPIVCDVEDEMLSRLESITDSEEKRKVIGNFYVEVFEREMKKLVFGHSGAKRSGAIESHEKQSDPIGRFPIENSLQDDENKVKFLLQGTIYSDVIESQGTKHASKIKSHHNVGGLPEHMKLQLLEPLRELYKDEVRALGKLLELPEEFVQKQPFPGPGFAVRIRGEVTKERLSQEKQADSIVLEELKKADWLSKVFISFPVMTGADSTAVKGDGKFMGEVIALRVVDSKDIMTATWAKLPYDLLQRISSRIVNEVPNISRVVYDISTKPPATMEWE